MSEPIVTINGVPMSKKIKGHFKREKKTYITIAVTTVVVAGITTAIVKTHSNSSISRGIAVTAQRVHDIPGDTSVNALEVSRGGEVLGNSYTALNGDIKLKDVTTITVRDGSNNVFNLYEAMRQGPPSWIVRCKETGVIFMSQSEAAQKMGLAANELSQHLNGIREHVEGYTFERIAMAA